MSRKCFARLCCVFEEGDHLYKSPRNPERYRHWAEFVGMEPNPTKQKRIRLCQRHFERKYFSILNGKPVLCDPDTSPTLQIQGPEIEFPQNGRNFARTFAALSALSRLPLCDLKKFILLLGDKGDPAVTKIFLPIDPLACASTSVPSTSEPSPPSRSLEPSINQFLFDSMATCMRTFVKKGDHDHCFCSLTFGEMPIKERLDYDPKSDRFFGLEGVGEFFAELTDTLANAVLVFMVRGLTDSWKQPVAFYFSRDGVAPHTLVRLLREVMGACEKAGMAIVATVCDVNSRNVRAMRMMGASTFDPCFEFNSRMIVSLYDAPHLLKRTRDLLYRDEIRVPVDDVGGAVSWDTTSWDCVRVGYRADEGRHVKYFERFTGKNLDPEGRDAECVPTAAQVLSNLMAIAVGDVTQASTLRSPGRATSKVCREINKLFDSMNSSRCDSYDGYGLRRPLCRKREKVHIKFWSAIYDDLQSWKYYRTNKDTAEKEEFTPPSHRGWLQTIIGVVLLWKNLKEYYVDDLQLRRLNQDPLENLFESIRHHSGSVRNPTVTQFMSGLKTSLLEVDEDFEYVNCENDRCRLLLDNMKEFFSETSDSVEHDKVDKSPSNSLASITGCIGRKILSNGDCDRCKAMLATDSSKDLDLVGIGFKCSEDGPDFLYPTDSFVKLVGSVVNVAERVLDEVAHLGGIKRRVVEASKREINLDWVKDGCSEHHMSVSDSIVDTCATLVIRWWTSKVNSKMV